MIMVKQGAVLLQTSMPIPHRKRWWPRWLHHVLTKFLLQIFVHSSRGAYGDAMTVSFSVQTLQFRDPSAQVYSYKHWLVNHSFREEGRWMSMDVVPQVSWRFLLSGLVATSSSALVMSVFNLLLLLFEIFFCWASSHRHQILNCPHLLQQKRRRTYS